MGNGYAILIWAEWGCGLVRALNAALAAAKEAAP